MVDGAATIVEGYYSSVDWLSISYGYIHAAIAVLMSMEALGGARGHYRRFFHGSLLNRRLSLNFPHN